MRRGGRGVFGAQREQRAFVGKGSGASFCGSQGGCYVCGWGIAKDEEFYERAHEDYD